MCFRCCGDDVVKKPTPKPTQSPGGLGRPGPVFEFNLGPVFESILGPNFESILGPVFGSILGPVFESILGPFSHQNRVRRVWFFPSGGPGLGTWEPRRGVILYGNLRTKHVLLNSGPNFGPKPGPKIDSKPGPKLIQKRGDP